LNLSKEAFEQTIKKDLQMNQWIVFSSMMISLCLFIVNENNVYWSLLLLCIGSISLVTINNCKSDRKHYDSGQLKSAYGKLVDIFPENEKAQKWILFIQEDSTGKIVEIVSKEKPIADLQEHYQVLFTPHLKILVKIS